MTTEDAEPPEIIFACSTVRLPDTEIALCTDCGATVYRTSGSLAKLKRAKVVCVACWQKIELWEFGGFMHHGELAEPRTYQSYLLAEYLKVSRRAK